MILIRYDLNTGNWSAVNVYSANETSVGENPVFDVKGTKESGWPLLSWMLIVCPLLLRFSYPGNGTKIGLKFWFSLIA